MFRAELQEKFQKIFGFKKVTFEAPSDSFEQDTLFIEIESCRSNASAGRVNARVQGRLVYFVQSTKASYGMLSKRLSKANTELTEKLFFFDMDTEFLGSPARMQNICERRASFVYLYSADHDPEHGSLSSVEFDIARPLIDKGDEGNIDVGDGEVLKA